MQWDPEVERDLLLIPLLCLLGADKDGFVMSIGGSSRKKQSVISAGALGKGVVFLGQMKAHAGCYGSEWQPGLWVITGLWTWGHLSLHSAESALGL